MSVTATNLVQGPGTLYYGAFGATEPADTAVNSDPSAGTWTDVGGTKDGVTLTVNQAFSELEVDQIVDVVGRRLTKRDMMISANMAEPTLENLSLAVNGGGAVTTGSGFKAFEPGNDTSVTQPTYIALIFDGWAPGTAKTRRVIGRKMLSTDNVEVAYKKDAQTIFTAKWSAHYVSASIRPYKIVDET